MNSNLSQIKNKLKKYLKDKEILDIVVFGSAVKGKTLPNDIDIAIVTEKEISPNIQDYHILTLSPQDFFTNPPTLVSTLLREGYSLKSNKSFSEKYRFSSKILFRYELSGLSQSKKVRIVNLLRGKKEEKGLVEKNKGEWLANQVFIALPETEHLFSQFFQNFKTKFKKYYILIH